MKYPLRVAPDLSLPLEFATQATGVIAKRRVGKSYTARRIVEEVLKSGQQVVIADPKGDWWGIRSSADGKGEGYPVIILGGEHGDLPLEVGSGEVVAKMAVEERVSILLDLSHLRKREVATFMTAFMETLYRLKAKESNRTPLLFVIDEADAIAAQKPNPGEERMLGAAEDIVRRGGQRGIGCMMITQRSAVLNKNVLTQCEMLIALRTIAPQDLKAMQAWIDVHGTDEEREQLMGSLPSLPKGQAWFWSPGWPTEKGIFQLVEVPKIETFDSGATPAAGEKRVEPKRWTDVDLDALKRQMADTVERAKADDPAALHARIRQLETQLSKTHFDQEQVEPIIRKEVDRQVDAYRKMEITAMADTATELVKVASLLEGGASRLRDVSDQLRVALDKAPAPAIIGGRTVHESSSQRGQRLGLTGVDRLIRSVTPAPRIPLPDGIEKLAPVQQRIIDTIAGLERLGVSTPDKATVAALCGYHPNAKSYANAMGALRSSEVVDYPTGGRVKLTALGDAMAVPGLPVRNVKELHEMWALKLGGTAAKILHAVVGAYPEAISAEALAEAAGYHPNAKSFANTKGRMRTLGLIEYPSSGMVKASEILFPKGLR